MPQTEPQTFDSVDAAFVKRRIIAGVSYIEGYDPSFECLLAKAVAYFYESSVARKTVTFSRPTFLEWLRRKPRTVTFDCSDVLIDPPKLPDKTLRRFAIVPDKEVNADVAD